MLLGSIASNTSKGGLFQSSGPSIKYNFENSLQYDADSLYATSCRWDGTPLNATDYDECACNFNSTINQAGSYDVICSNQTEQPFNFKKKSQIVYGYTCTSDRPICIGFVNEVGGNWGRCIESENDMNPDVNRIYAYGEEHLDSESFVNPCNAFAMDVTPKEFIIDKKGLDGIHEQIAEFAREYKSFVNLADDAPGRIAVGGWGFDGGDLPVTITLPVGDPMPNVTIIGRKGCTDSRSYPRDSFSLHDYCRSSIDLDYIQNVKEVQAAFAVFTATFEGGSSGLLGKYEVGSGVSTWQTFADYMEANDDADLEMMRIFSVIWARIRGPHKEQPIWTHTYRTHSSQCGDSIGFKFTKLVPDEIASSNLLHRIDLPEAMKFTTEENNEFTIVSFHASLGPTWTASILSAAPIDGNWFTLNPTNLVFVEIQGAPITSYFSPFNTEYLSSISPDITTSPTITNIGVAITVQPFDNTWIIPDDLSTYPIPEVDFEGVIVLYRDNVQGLAYTGATAKYFANVDTITDDMKQLPDKTYFVPRVRFPWVRVNGFITFSKRIAMKPNSVVTFESMWTGSKYVQFDYVSPGVILADTPGDSGYLSFTYFEIVDDPDETVNLFTIPLPDRVAYAKQYADVLVGFEESYGICGTGVVSTGLPGYIQPSSPDQCQLTGSYIDNQTFARRGLCELDVFSSEPKYVQYCLDYLYLQQQYQTTVNYASDLQSCIGPWSPSTVSDTIKYNPSNPETTARQFTKLAEFLDISSLNPVVRSGYARWVQIDPVELSDCGCSEIPTIPGSQACQQIELLNNYLGTIDMSMYDYYRDDDWFNTSHVQEWGYKRGAWNVTLDSSATRRYEYCSGPTKFEEDTSTVDTTDNYPSNCQPIDVPMGGHRAISVGSARIDRCHGSSCTQDTNFFGIIPPIGYYNLFALYTNYNGKVISTLITTISEANRTNACGLCNGGGVSQIPTASCSGTSLDFGGRLELELPYQQPVWFSYCTQSVYNPAKCLTLDQLNSGYNPCDASWDMQDRSNMMLADQNRALSCYGDGVISSGNFPEYYYICDCHFAIHGYTSVLPLTNKEQLVFDQPSFSSSTFSDKNRRYEALLFARFNARSSDYLNNIRNYIHTIFRDTTLREDFVDKFNSTEFANSNFNVSALVAAYNSPTTKNSVNVDDYLLPGHTFERMFTYDTRVSRDDTIVLTKATSGLTFDRFCMEQEFLSDCTIFDQSPTLMALEYQTMGYGNKSGSDNVSNINSCNEYCRYFVGFSYDSNECACYTTDEMAVSHSGGTPRYKQRPITSPVFCYGGAFEPTDFEVSPSIVNGPLVVKRTVERPHFLDPENLAVVDEPNTLTVPDLTNWCAYKLGEAVSESDCSHEGRSTLCVWSADECLLRDEPTCYSLTQTECENSTYWSICVFVQRYAYDPADATLVGATTGYGAAMVGNNPGMLSLDACVSLSFMVELNSTTADTLCVDQIIESTDGKCEFTSLDDIVARTTVAWSEWTYITGQHWFGSTDVDSVAYGLPPSVADIDPDKAWMGTNYTRVINSVSPNPFARWQNTQKLKLPTVQGTSTLVTLSVDKVCSVEVETSGFPGQCMSDTTQQINPLYISRTDDLGMYLCNAIFDGNQGFVDDMVCNRPYKIEGDQIIFDTSARTLKLSHACLVNGKPPMVPRVNNSLRLHLCRPYGDSYRLVDGMSITDSQRHEICENQGGTNVSIGLRLELITLDNICNSKLRYCIIFPDEVKYNTVKSVADELDLTGYTIYLSTIPIAYATRHKFQEVTTNVVYTNGPSGIYEFTARDIEIEDKFTEAFFHTGPFPLSCIDTLILLYNNSLMQNGSYLLKDSDMIARAHPPSDIFDVQFTEDKITIDKLDVTLTSIGGISTLSASTECTRLVVYNTGFKCSFLNINQTLCAPETTELYLRNPIVFNGLDVSDFTLHNITVIGSDRAVLISSDFDYDLPSVTVGESSIDSVFVTHHGGPLVTALRATGTLSVARCPLASLGNYCELDNCNIYATNWTVPANRSGESSLTVDDLGVVSLNNASFFGAELVGDFIINPDTNKCVGIVDNIVGLGTTCTKFVNINNRVQVVGNPYFCFYEDGGAVYHQPCVGCDSGYGPPMVCPITNKQQRVINQTHCSSDFGPTPCTYCGLKGNSCVAGSPWRCLSSIQGSLTSCHTPIPNVTWAICDGATLISPGYGAIGLDFIENFYYKHTNLFILAPTFDIIESDQQSFLIPFEGKSLINEILLGVVGLIWVMILY